MTVAQQLGHREPAPARPAPWNLGRALALLADHRCACLGCEGATTSCEWPSWRRCELCGCMWKPAEIRGRRYAETVRGRCTANELEEER